MTTCPEFHVCYVMIRVIMRGNRGLWTNLLTITLQIRKKERKKKLGNLSKETLW